MAASFTTGFPSTFGRFEKTGYECPTGYPTSFTPSTTSTVPSTFGGYPWTNEWSRFGGNFNTPSTFVGNFGTFPAEWFRFGGNFGGNFTGYPWSNFGATTPFTYGGYPAEWSRFGGFPWANNFGGNFGTFPAEWSRFGGFNTPSTFGGYPWTNEWSRFGGYPWTNFGGNFGGNFGENWTAGYPWTNEWSRFGGNFNTPSTFGGFPWTNESTYGYPWSRFGGYESFPWARFGGNFENYGYPLNRFGGYESFPWSRLGGDFTSTYPWARDFSSRYNVPTSWFGNTFDFTGLDDFERSLMNVSRELFNIKNLFDFGKRKEATTGNRGVYSTSMVQLPSRPTSSLEYYTFQNPIRFDAYGQRWLSLCFDLPSFKPEEITVTLYSKATPAPYIEILASHDVKETKEHNIKRTYERKFYFPSDLYLKPEDIAKLEIKSHFSNDGVLHVEAKLPHLSAEEARKERTHYPVWSVPIKTEKKDM